MNAYTVVSADWANAYCCAYALANGHSCQIVGKRGWFRITKPGWDYGAVYRKSEIIAMTDRLLARLEGRL